MRIAKPLSFVAKQMTKSMIKRTALATLSFTLLASGVMAVQNLLVSPQTAQAATPPDSCFAFDAVTGAITDYYNNEGNNSANPACPKAVDIPSTIGGVPVTTIGNIAFSNNQLTNLTIPSSVTSIGNYAFSSNQLTNLTIPSSVTSIGNNAFTNNQLTNLTIPSSVTSIGNYAFTNNQLTNLTIPSSVTSIGNYAFSNNQLTNPSIPNSVTSMQHTIFHSNPISSMTIGSTTIYSTQSPTADPACFEMTGSTVTDYHANSPIVARDNGVLCGTDVIIPSSVTAVDDYAFMREGLTTVTIPSSVVSLGWSAFYGNKLTSVTFHEGLQSIDGYAFQVNQLPAVTVPSSLTSIHPSAFALQTPWGGDVLVARNPEIPYLWSSNSAEVQRLFDNIWYVRLYTADPTNPQNLTNGILPEVYEMGQDANANGTEQDSLGGHLINPSSTTASYYSANGSELASTKTITGRLPNGNDLTDYLAKNVQTPAFVDPVNPTPAEQTALNEALSAYYRIGNTPTFTPPTIAGYITPPSQTKQLTAANNSLSFTYNQQVLSVPFAYNTVTGGTLAPSATPASITSPLIRESNLAIANDGACSAIESAELLSPGVVTAPAGVTILGGLQFSLSCSSAATTTVTLTLGSKSDLAQLRIYKEASGTLTDITHQVTLANTNGKTVLSYESTDGGSFDEDGVANSMIVDPIYIGEVMGASSTLPGSGLLASTGANAYILLAVATTLLAGAFVFWRKGLRPRNEVTFR